MKKLSISTLTANGQRECGEIAHQGDREAYCFYAPLWSILSVEGFAAQRRSPQASR
jgi:hypothetical protein